MLSLLRDTTFASSWAFALLLFPIAFIVWHFWRQKELYPSFRLPILEGVKEEIQPLRGVLKQYSFLLRAIGAIFLIVALARPQTSQSKQNVENEGIDIVLALDISGSMLAQDFRPNRLEAAKNVAKEFVQARPSDRIGVVVFAGESYTQCPVTTDHNVISKLLGEIEQGLIEDGTAIGMGLATAVNRLKDTETKSKIIILMTDGVNNQGSIDPLNATEAARQKGIRVYTVGVGTQGYAPFPYSTPLGTRYKNTEVEIDEELLKEIANKTGGQYFRATDNDKLKEVYKEIDELEKSRIEVTRVTKMEEKFHLFLLIGMILLGLEWILRYTWFRSIP